MLLIKLKKHKENAAEKIDGQLLTILQQIEDVEWASVSVQVFSAMRAGTDALNKIHDEMSVDDVKCLLDETKEAIEIENEINTLLAGQTLGIDEDTLMKELDNLVALSAQSDDRKLNSVVFPTAPSDNIEILPAVPTHNISIENNQSIPSQHSNKVVELAS